MTAALLFLLAGATAPAIELPDPEQDRVTVQAVARVPELDAVDRAALRVLAEVLATSSTRTYAAVDLRAAGALTGEPLRVRATPDALRISLSVPRGGVTDAVAMVASVVREPNFDDDAIRRVRDEAPFRGRTIWAVALDPERLPFQGVRERDVRALATRLLRPDNLTVAIGGAFTPGEGAAAWAARTDGWEVPRPVPPRTVSPATDRAPTTGGEASAIELAGPAFSATDAALPSRVLALFALGNGKGATLWTTVRAENGWSYRQEAVLTPTPSGFRPRLVLLRKAERPAEAVEPIRKALLTAIEKWTDADRDRALGLADGVLSYGNPLSPLYLSGEFPLSGRLEDRTFLDAYWRMKTGRPWNAARLLTEMRATDLAELKRIATEWVQSAEARVVPGDGATAGS